MDADPHVKLLQVTVLGGISDLLNDLNHLQACLKNPVALVNHNGAISLVLVEPPVVAHDHVAIANSVHFVDLVLLTELIEPTEEL